MGKVKDKLMELEEAGVVHWDFEIEAYVATATSVPPVAFDLDLYLTNLELEKKAKQLANDHDLQVLLMDKYSVTIFGQQYIDEFLLLCIIKTVREFDKEHS